MKNLNWYNVKLNIVEKSRNFERFNQIGFIFLTLEIWKDSKNLCDKNMMAITTYWMPNDYTFNLISSKRANPKPGAPEYIIMHLDTPRSDLKTAHARTTTPVLETLQAPAPRPHPPFASGAGLPPPSDVSRLNPPPTQPDIHGSHPPFLSPPKQNNQNKVTCQIKTPASHEKICTKATGCTNPCSKSNKNIQNTVLISVCNQYKYPPFNSHISRRF